jgi:hypothetical protein
VGAAVPGSYGTDIGSGGLGGDFFMLASTEFGPVVVEATGAPLASTRTRTLIGSAIISDFVDG